MRYEEGVVPRATLVEAYGIREVSARRRVELTEVFAILAYGAHRAICLRVVVLPPLGTLTQGLGKLPIATLLGKCCKGIVGNVVLQGVRYGVVARHILGEETYGDVALLSMGLCHDVWRYPCLVLSPSVS